MSRLRASRRFQSAMVIADGSSPDLFPSAWVDILVTSPYIVTPSAFTFRKFFRVRR